MSKAGKIETKWVQTDLEISPTQPCQSPNRTSAVQAGNILFLSGRFRAASYAAEHQAVRQGRWYCDGAGGVCVCQVGALCMLASIKKAVSNFDRVTRTVNGA